MGNGDETTLDCRHVSDDLKHRKRVAASKYQMHNAQSKPAAMWLAPPG